MSITVNHEGKKHRKCYQLIAINKFHSNEAGYPFCRIRQESTSHFKKLINTISILGHILLIRMTTGMQMTILVMNLHISFRQIQMTTHSKTSFRSLRDFDTHQLHQDPVKHFQVMQNKGKCKAPKKLTAKIPRYPMGILAH